MSTMKRLIAVFLLFSAPALAQDDNAPVIPAPEESAGEEPAVAAPETPPEETREERLERLFGTLAVMEQSDAAEKVADQIVVLLAQSGSPSMDLLLNRARKAMDAEDYEKARAHAAALTRLAPDFAEGWNASATLYFLQEDYGKSVAHIERTLALEPRHFGALSGLALILERVDRKEAALDTWREVAAIFPGMERATEAIERLTVEVEGKGI
ncbi:MAG: hypothetical protein AAF401_12050 [Pseudomonadota bacterium]